MAQPFKLKQSNALKHGVYSTIGLLPGESPASDVIGEFRPNEPVGHDIVMRIARCAEAKSRNVSNRPTGKISSRISSQRSS